MLCFCVKISQFFTSLSSDMLYSLIRCGNKDSSICVYAAKKNASHANEVLPQDTTHFTQRSPYQRRSLCQDPAGDRTIRRPDYRKQTQTEVIRTSLPFIRSGQNILQGTVKGGKKTRQTKEELGRQHQEMDRPGVREVPDGSGEQGKMEGNWF